MSFDKAIEHKKEHRKPYRKLCEQIDKSCRCHGGCEYCLGNRMYQKKKELQKMLDREKDLQYNKSIEREVKSMNKFYEAYKEMRQSGMTVEQSFRWAKMMRACNYNPFAD